MYDSMAKDAPPNPAKGIQTPNMPTKPVRGEDNHTVIITPKGKKK